MRIVVHQCRSLLPTLLRTTATAATTPIVRRLLSVIRSMVIMTITATVILTRVE